MASTLPKSLQELLKGLQILPGVGPKTAQRMALHLLVKKRRAGVKLANDLKIALDSIVECRLCRNFAEETLCSICLDQNRDRTILSIIESPLDLVAFEALEEYRGLYFLLLGRISPMEGVFPEHIGLDLLERRFAKESFREVVLATNSTIEGEMTAQFISKLAAKYKIPTSRLAHGLPMGSELEHLDRLTLRYAFDGRKNMDGLDHSRS